MPKIVTADRAVVSVTATLSSDWEVVSTPTGFRGITSADFADNDKLAGFLLHENGEDYEVYDTLDDDTSALLEIANISGTVTITRPATPYKSSNGGARISAGSGTHTLVLGMGSGTATRLMRETNPTWLTFTSGDATPSVADYRLFKTAGTTTITAFDDMTDGSIFVVQRGASDITIADGAGISLPNDTNITLTAAQPLALFTVDNGVAHLVSRAGLPDVLPNAKASTELTIATGAITPTQASHTVDTESDAASDDLDTITATNFKAGDTLTLYAADGARTVVVKHNTGNIQHPDGEDVTLDDAIKTVQLRYDGTNWNVLNGGATATQLNSVLPAVQNPASSAPSTERDGTALAAGGLWFDTTANTEALKAYVGGWGRLGVTHTFKMYGAVGDDDGAGAGTDDATAIQDAINSVSNLGGGIIDGENLWYNIATKITLKSNVFIQNAKFFWDGGEVANQRILNNNGTAGVFGLKNVTVHRGNTASDNVPADLTTTAPDPTSHSGIDIRRTSGTDLFVYIEACEVTGDGVGSGIIVGGATGGYVRHCYVHDMEWDAEAATTPADVGFSNVNGNDGINGIYQFDCIDFHVYNNRIEDLTVSYDDGGGAASFNLGTRGIAAGVGGGAGNLDCTCYGNTVRRVSQGIDYTGGSATGSNRRIKIYSNTVEDAYYYGIKGANTFIEGQIFGNSIRRAGLGAIVLNSSSGNTVPQSLQTQNVLVYGNQIVGTGVFDIDIPADHNSGSGFVKASSTIFAFGLLELGGTNADYYPSGCVFANNVVDDINNKLSYVYHSNVQIDTTVQKSPNVHYGTIWKNASSGAESQDTWSNGPWNPRCLAYRTSDQSVAASTLTYVTFEDSRYDEYSMHSTSIITVPYAGNYRCKVFAITAPSTAASAKVMAAVVADKTGSGSYQIGIAAQQDGMATDDSTIGGAKVIADYKVRLWKGGRLRMQVAHDDTANLAFKGAGASAPPDETCVAMLVEYIPDYVEGIDMTLDPA